MYQLTLRYIYRQSSPYRVLHNYMHGNELPLNVNDSEEDFMRNIPTNKLIKYAKSNYGNKLIM